MYVWMYKKIQGPRNKTKNNSLQQSVFTKIFLKNKGCDHEEKSSNKIKL